MNANELAEDLEGAKLVILKLNEMLRQQQAEIEALKTQCSLLQEGYNAQAILLGVETGITPDFFYMEHDIQGER